MMARPASVWFFSLSAFLLLAAVTAPVLYVLATVSPLEAATAFSAPAAAEAVRVSLVASLAATAVASFLGIPAGYWLARLPARAGAPLLFLLALPLAFPPVASSIMLLSLVRFTPLPDTLAGVALAEFFVSGSFVAVASAAAFSMRDPVYEEAARTLGVSEWRIFREVALPACAPSIAAGIAFAWLRAIGEYGATSIVAYHPTSLPVALYVALSASGVRASLALTYGFVVLASGVLAAAWVLRRRV
jgi:molybdate/tungstate transport system permease protein